MGEETRSNRKDSQNTAPESAPKSQLDLLRSAGFYLSAPCGGKGRCGKCKVRVTGDEPPVSEADARLLSEDELEQGVRLACTLTPSDSYTIEILGDRESDFDALAGYGKGGNIEPALKAEDISLPKTSRSLVKTLTGSDTAPSLAFLRACSEIVEVGSREATLYSDTSGPLYAAAGDAALFGIGIDIGTTTVVFELVELATGRAVGRHSTINKQRAYGGDVISRIVHAGKGEGPAMAASISGQISEGVALLCEKHGIPAPRLVKMAIAGNTTMLHLLLGLSCKTLGVYPFTPITLERLEIRYKELFEGDFDPLVTLLPGISTYVGADISAGLLFSGAYRAPADKPALLVDIGTNGEMALVADGKILCTSTAAGPAFEGGNIAAGTGSVPGAICGARLEDGALALHTIGDEPAAGICGTGVIDVVAASLAGGWLAPSGRYDKSVDKAGLLLATAPDGTEIRFTQKDVRELQFAKSALRTGIDILIETAGLVPGDVHTLYLAGGFGYHINVSSAAAIGLLPDELVDRTVTLGNSSLGGAVRLLLDAEAGRALEEITAATSEFSLSENSSFNDLFIENSAFPG